MEYNLGRLETIERGETRVFDLEFQVLDGKEETGVFEERVRGLCACGRKGCSLWRSQGGMLRRKFRIPRRGGGR